MTTMWVIRSFGGDDVVAVEGVCGHLQMGQRSMVPKAWQAGPGMVPMALIMGFSKSHTRLDDSDVAVQRDVADIHGEATPKRQKNNS